MERMGAFLAQDHGAWRASAPMRLARCDAPLSDDGAAAVESALGRGPPHSPQTG